MSLLEVKGAPPGLPGGARRLGSEPKPYAAGSAEGMSRMPRGSAGAVQVLSPGASPRPFGPQGPQMLNEGWVLRGLCAATPRLSAGPLTTPGSDLGPARNRPAAETSWLPRMRVSWPPELAEGRLRPRGWRALPTHGPVAWLGAQEPSERPRPPMNSLF